MTDATLPPPHEPKEGVSLPVVAWGAKITKAREVCDPNFVAYESEEETRDMILAWNSIYECFPLTPQVPAQATIDELRAEVERLTMHTENLSAEGQLAYKVSENVGRNALQCAQDLLQKNIELRALVAEMLGFSDNWPGIAYANELEVRARAALLGDGGTL